jgi:uncharacterized membrane protein HdeD (DUF308 family)
MAEHREARAGGVTGDRPILAPEWIRENWAWIAALGTILMVGGVLALLMPISAGIAATLVIGSAFVVSGAVQLYQCSRSRGWHGRGWHMLGGAIYLVGGLLLLLQPLAGVVALSLLLIAILVVQGVTRIAVAFRMRPGRGWGWVATSGGLSALVGMLALFILPLSSLTLLGVFAAVTIGIEGAALTYYAFAARPTEDRTVTPDVNDKRREAKA